MNKRSVSRTRGKIQAAALQVFASQGFANASMRQVADAAGISVGGLYLYFKNKEELCLTLIRESLQQFSVRADEMLRDLADPAEQLQSYVRFAIEYSRTHRELIFLQGRELGAGFGLELKREFFRKRRELLQSIIGAGVASGAFRNCDPMAAAGLVISTLRGFVISMMLEEEVTASADDFAEYVLHGVARRSEK